MTPLVLIHGFLATRTLMRPLQRRLEEAGYAVHLVHLDPLCVQDIRHLAAQLDHEVERILAETGALRCDLVGVSQGGVLGLWYLKRLGGARRVARFVAVGAPFGGTWFALVGLPLLGAVSRGIWQLLPGGEVLAELREGGPPRGVATALLALAGDPVAPPERCGLPGLAPVVIPGGASPWRHQALVLSPAVARAIDEALRGLRGCPGQTG